MESELERLGDLRRGWEAAIPLRLTGSKGSRFLAVATLTGVGGWGVCEYSSGFYQARRQGRKGEEGEGGERQGTQDVHKKERKRVH